MATYARNKVIVFLGPPGSGKGTQAACLSSVLGIPAISTGEMLRREQQSDSMIGQTVQAVLNSGRLVSDELMNQVVARRLRESDCQAGCILDGYPRTLAQARFLSQLLRGMKFGTPVIFDLDICSDEVVTRLSRRQRPDDQPEAIRERLRLYKQNADVLVRYYRNKHYYRIPAARTPEEISDELLIKLNFSSQPAEAVVRVKKHFYATACLSRPL